MSQKCHAQGLCWEAQCNIPLISEEESVSNSCTIPETKSLHLRQHPERKGLCFMQSIFWGFHSLLVSGRLTVRYSSHGL